MAPGSIKIFNEPPYQNQFDLIAAQYAKPNKPSALDKQINGDHYKHGKIQAIEFIHANDLNFMEGSAVKYITRHRRKGGRIDLEKAIHYLEMLIELEYGKDTNGA